MDTKLRKAFIEAIDQRVMAHSRDLGASDDKMLLNYARSAQLTTKEALEAAGFKPKQVEAIVEWIYAVPKAA